MYQVVNRLNLRILLPTGLIALLFSILISSSMQASALSSPVGQVTPIPTVPTPPHVIALSIVNSSGNAQLSWTDSLADWLHEVHRSTTPFFTATGSTVIASLPLGTTSYVDTSSGIGSVGTNHFYRVIASNGITTQPSNWVGEMDYSLNTSNGAYSLIGIPFDSPSPSDAAGLATQIGNVNTVLGWNVGTQTFRTYTPNTGNFNFTIGNAIFVQVGTGAASSVNIVGRLNHAALTLRPAGYNFITLPVQCDELATASDVASDITNVTNLLSWLPNTQSFRAFTPPNTGNFAVAVGTPLIVELNNAGPISWPTGAGLCQ